MGAINCPGIGQVGHFYVFNIVMWNTFSKFMYATHYSVFETTQPVDD